MGWETPSVGDVDGLVDGTRGARAWGRHGEHDSRVTAEKLEDL